LLVRQSDVAVGVQPVAAPNPIFVTKATLGAPPSPDHAADALAVAVCHANRSPLAAAVLA
jgi:hypothetical protein